MENLSRAVNRIQIDVSDVGIDVNVLLEIVPGHRNFEKESKF